MKKKTKRKQIKPDDTFSKGPFHMERYGKNVFMEANWPEGAHKEMMKKAALMYPEIVAEIDGHVEAIANLVRQLPPDRLLYRAWRELAFSAFMVDSEAELGAEDSVSMRMLDYVQSVIASVDPAEDQKSDLSEEDWQELRRNVSELFNSLTINYQICRTAKAKYEDPDYSLEYDEFYFRAQTYWCNVRGERYQVHEIPYLNDLFSQHSDILKELFGLTSDQFVVEMGKIWHSLTFGIQDIMEELDSFRRDTLDAIEEKIKSESIDDEVGMPELMKAVIIENGWEDRQERVFDRFQGVGLFDVQETTLLPENLINELTWDPGEDEDFFAEGEYRGWPLRIWPIFKKPFIRLNGRCCCFDLHGLFDKIYRVMQRIIWRLKPDYRETWNNIQKEQSEDLPFKYFSNILPKSNNYRSVYYRWDTEAGASGRNWCEVDGLLVYDDCLFIIEVKAGAFTYTSPADDFPAFIKSLENLVMKPAMQGKRFLEYLNSTDTVPLFNEEHVKIGELSLNDFRQIVICPISLDPFTEMAAQVQHLSGVGINVGDYPIWAISLDDLRVYADVFDNPLVFIHYVKQRMRAFRSALIQVDDELDHLGLYVAHNNYSAHAEKLQGDSNAKIMHTGYRIEIDKFFSSRLIEPDTPCPLKQDMHRRIYEIISLITESDSPGRSELACYILDLDGKTRDAIATHIEQEMGAQPTTKRPKPISTHGGIDFTVFCYRYPHALRSADFALKHTRAVTLVNDDEQRMLIELVYTDECVLSDVHWQWVERSAIPHDESGELERMAQMLRTTRISAAKKKRRKIGRNAPCPCGSGKKFKKCCLGK